jgi:hypothetical protein
MYAVLLCTVYADPTGWKLEAKQEGESKWDLLDEQCCQPPSEAQPASEWAWLGDTEKDLAATVVPTPPITPGDRSAWVFPAPRKVKFWIKVGIDSKRCD